MMMRLVTRAVNVTDLQPGQWVILDGGAVAGGAVAQVTKVVPDPHFSYLFYVWYRIFEYGANDVFESRHLMGKEENLIVIEQKEV